MLDHVESCLSTYLASNCKLCCPEAVKDQGQRDEEEIHDLSSWSLTENGNGRCQDRDAVQDATRSQSSRSDRALFNPDNRMKQAQSGPTRASHALWVQAGRAQATPSTRANAFRNPSFQEIGRSARQVRTLVGMLSSVWYLVTLPFRLVIGIIAWLGRLMGVVLGFLLMVVGVALWAGPLFFFGILLFIVGLLLSLRCLGSR
jgi:hypothetical protein